MHRYTTPVSVKAIVAIVGSVSFFLTLPFFEMKTNILRRMSLPELAAMCFLFETIDYQPFKKTGYTGSLILYI